MKTKLASKLKINGLVLVISGLSLWSGVNSWAAIMVTVGDHFLQPNMAGQAITLDVVNTGSSAVTISGLNLIVQVADSGPGSVGGLGTTLGPWITGVDIITGTIFSANNDGNNVALYPDPSASKQFVIDYTKTTGGSTLNLPVGSSRLATVTFDTTGFSSSGSKWDLWLGTTINGPDSTYYTDATFVDPIPMTIIEPGSLTLVPEPASMALVGGLLCVFGCWFRRNKQLRQAGE